jgi:hypothetical protein
MVYIATYIFEINVIWVYHKNYILILYSVYTTVILLLDSCIEATIYRKKDSACIRIAIGKMALSPEAEDFFTFTWEFLYFTTYTHSRKVFNKNDELHLKINHRQISCFSLITCEVGIYLFR